jgi:nucleotide-binding universal stress UspA family protein
MKLQTIVFPTDFSPASESALGVATTVARATTARLLIVHVKHEPHGEKPSEAAMDPDSISLARMLEEVRPNDTTVPYAHRLVSGTAAEEIIALAERERADLIVMATHGRTGLARMLMGSVAEEVVRRASCAVLTVKGVSGEG